MTNFKLIISWTVRLLTAFILLQTLYFKFSGTEESVYIFSKLGIEPWGRYVSGIVELMAAVLILIPAYTGLGALIAAGLMTGAIFSHFSILGIEIHQDGGLLFLYAVIVFTCSVYLLVEKRNTIPIIGKYFI